VLWHRSLLRLRLLRRRRALEVLLGLFHLEVRPRPGLDLGRLRSLPAMQADRLRKVDDAHGSPEQRCPRAIARYCRGQTLRFTNPCWCTHERIPTEGATYQLKAIRLDSAKADEITSAFHKTWHHPTRKPVITAIHVVSNKALESLHRQFADYLARKNGERSREVELYHGTNNLILDTVYTHGLAPPSDMEASEDCPVSGGKGLRTSLCNNDCKYCVKQHHWNRCHMFGLGVYLADISSKSHRYISGAKDLYNGGRECKMIICSVLLGDALQVDGHLREPDSMHNVFSTRSLTSSGVNRMMDLVKPISGNSSLDQRDILFVKGLGEHCHGGSSVMNNEFISFHRYQSLPRYEITYIA